MRRRCDTLDEDCSGRVPYTKRKNKVHRMSAERSRATAALAATLLLAGVGASPAIADNCMMLTETDNVFFSSVPVASQKPQNLEVIQNPLYGAALGGWRLTWTIAPDFPQDVLTGNCVHHSHPASGREKEYCNNEHTLAPASTCWESPNTSDPTVFCPRGTHRYKVKFRTRCAVTMPWSATVERDHVTD